MSYKVQLKTKGSRIIMDIKFPYKQIHEVPKKVYDYIKANFAADFNFFEPKPKVNKVVEEKAERKAKADYGIIKKDKTNRKNNKANLEEGFKKAE